MLVATPEEARRIAVEALSLGWIDGNQLWDIACRFIQKGVPLDPQELFERTLSKEQIDKILQSDPDIWPESTLISIRVPDSLSLEPGTGRPTPPPQRHLTMLDASFMSEDSVSGQKTRVMSTDKVESEAASPLASPPSPGAVTPAKELPQGSPALSPLEETSQLSTGRYQLLEELGRGSEGTVYCAGDREIGRTVALKTLRKGNAADPSTHKRFLNEAQLTSRLEHPSVIPVYDIGRLSNGQIFYTMRIVKQRSLQEILQKPPPRPDWPIARLCSIFVQVCRAMAYAHARGVIHCDLKPANILLGDYGEVYVADWGIARVLNESEVDTTPVAKETATRVENEAGLVAGTPGYMAPEQIRAEWSTIDHRADLFSLGAILYEILTGQKPFTGKLPRAILLATLGQEPKRPRELAPNCPLVLEDLCLKLLSKSKEDRPASAEAVAAEVEAFLEGNKERERRREEALGLVEQAKVPASLYKELAQEQERLLQEARQCWKGINPWDPVAKKQKAWLLEDRAKALEVERARVLADTIELYLQALAYDPDCQEARGGLADIYWSQAREAEAERKEATRIYYEELVRDYDNGRYAQRLSANGYLSLRSSPSGAQVWSYRYQEQNRILIPSEETFLGETPLREVKLAPGSYLLILRYPGYRDVRYPFLCQRGEHHRAHVNLYDNKSLGEGFVYIPAGPCLLGGDREAQDPLPRQEVVLEDFAISRLPVTFAEYLEFINDLYPLQPRRIEKRLPRDETGDGLYVEQDEKGRWRPRAEHIVEGEGRRFCPPEKIGQLPVFAIDWFDAVAYCRWRSRRDGVQYRLVTELEYEKAARGADGRFFPWGDSFDPTFCKMRESRPGYSQPEPVGAFPFDESPYGVRDLAGGMRTWLADIHGSLDAAQALLEKEPPPGTNRDAVGMRGVRGGAWKLPELHCRAASRYRFFGADRDTTTGIRLARSLVSLERTSTTFILPEHR